jgi:formylglycine-generating enzyme required for sulfatase activity
MVTYFVVQAYQAGKNGYLVPDEARELPTERQAELAARLLATERPAVVAFSRSGDPVTGEWADAQIIYQAGELPDELFAAAG